MKRSGRVLLLFFLAISFLSLDVDREELLKGDKEIQFVNYEGPHKIIDTRAQIIAIGTQLGKNIALDKKSDSSYFDKYRVIHVVDPNQPDRLDADIFIIEKTALVDHIRNLRWIIMGYLQAAYGYTQEDAAILAKFVVYYNAVFRGNMEYFKTRYKEAVLSYLSQDNAGIATHYTQWAGKTRMLIPLTEKVEKGSLSSLKSDELTDKKVIEDLRTKEDMGLEDRKQMVELKEKEIEQDQTKIETKKEAVQKEEEALAQEKTKLEEEQKKTAAEKTRLAQEGGTAEEQAALQEQEAELKKSAEDIQKKEQKTEEAKQDIAQQEAAQEDRVATVQQERETISKDAQTLIDKEQEKSAQEQQAKTRTAVQEVLFLRLNTDDRLGSLIRINPAQARVEVASAVNSIHGKQFLPFNNNLLVIAGKEEGNGAIRLVFLDPKSLEMKSQGEDDIFADSELYTRGAFAYAVVGKEGKWYLGQFDNNLKLVSQSDQELFPYTSISATDEELFVQNREGKVIILAVSNLKTLEVLP